MPRIGAGARAGVVAGGRHDSDEEGAVAEVKAAAADNDALRRVTSFSGKRGQTRRNEKNEDIEDSHSQSRSGLRLEGFAFFYSFVIPNRF